MFTIKKQITKINSLNKNILIGNWLRQIFWKQHTLGI